MPRMIEPSPRRRLTPLKVNRAMVAVEELLRCRDLPESVSGDYGDVRASLEHTLMDDIGPLMQLFDDDKPPADSRIARGVRECRCGMEISADAMAMLAHVAGDEHAQRLADKGLERVRHSDARLPDAVGRN